MCHLITCEGGNIDFVFSTSSMGFTLTSSRIILYLHFTTINFCVSYICAHVSLDKRTLENKLKPFCPKHSQINKNNAIVVFFNPNLRVIQYGSFPFEFSKIFRALTFENTWLGTFEAPLHFKLKSCVIHV